MNTKIPDAVIHGVTSRIRERCTPDAVDTVAEKLGGEHDMSRSLTFIVPGYSNVDFHVMIRRADQRQNADEPEQWQWQVAILVVTKTQKFVYNEPPPVVAKIAAQPPTDLQGN